MARRILASSLAVLALLVGGCSGDGAGSDGSSDDPDPDADRKKRRAFDKEFVARSAYDIMVDSHTAMSTLGSVHVVDNDEDGSRISLRIDSAGDCLVELIEPGDAPYVMLAADDGQWSRFHDLTLREFADNPTDLRRLRRKFGDKWLPIEAKHSNNVYCDAHPFAEEPFRIATVHGLHRKVGRGRIDGIPVVEIAFRRDGERHVVSIVADGSTPYLLRHELVDRPGTSTVFRSLDDDFDIEPPKRNEIADFDDL